MVRSVRSLRASLIPAVPLVRPNVHLARCSDAPFAAFRDN